ncbi:hypothetical protein AB0K43_13240 [Kitasatospora sp. NPDC049258]|uniref:hypothetical protein n=1 Tax=Kitasatospora sp. NPDC049258 TaxID=3155394 RepID=UPI00341922F8
MKPKFRDDVFIAPTADGVHLRNERGPLDLRGPALYDWVERLSRLLDGSRTLAELTAGVSEDRGRFLRDLIGSLERTGFIKDCAADRPHGLTDEELRRFAPEISFIDAYRDSAAARFESYRGLRTLLLGAGPLLEAAAVAAWRTGLRAVDLAVTAEPPTDREALARRYAEIVGHDVDGPLSVVSAPADPTGLIEGHQLVLTVGDHTRDAVIRAVDRACHAGGTAVGHLCLLDDEAWISAPSSSPARWEDGWLRLGDQDGRSTARVRRAPATGRATLPATGSASAPAESEWLTGPAVPVAANHLVFASFAALTGVHQDTGKGELTVLDLKTLQTRTHTFDPHPLRSRATSPAGPRTGRRATGATRTTGATGATRSRAALADRVRALALGPELDPEEFSQGAAALFDPRTGIAADLDEQALLQLPLHLCTAVVADPVAPLLGTTRTRPTVVGSGFDLPTARAGAARAALEVYADLMACAVSASPRGAGGSRAGRARPARAGVWAWDVLRGEPRLLSADETPWQWPPPGSAYRRPRGLASGRSWIGALEAGVADAYVPEALERARAAGAVPTRVDLEQVTPDPQGRRLLRLLRLAQVPVCVWEVSGPLAAPVYLGALSEHGPVVAAAAAARPARALRTVLEQVLRTHQLRSSGAEYGPEPEVATPAPGAPIGVLDLSARWDLTTALAAAGRVPLAVPLDHDPVAAAVLPCTVRVVIADV